MRISDWSSDVCSSDLNEAVKGLTLYVTAQNSLGFGIQNDSLVAWKVKDGHFNPLKTQYLDHQGPVRLKATVKNASEVSLHFSIDGSNWSDFTVLTADNLAWWSWGRSEEHTSELQSLMRISYAVFCLKKKKRKTK